MESLVAFIVLALWLGGRVAHAEEPTEVTADQVPFNQQTYDFFPASRCRILAHDSVILQNEDHYILLIDGGMCTFLTQLDGVTVKVPDLNSFTVAFDLSHDFQTSPNLEPLWQHKKLNNTDEKLSIVNHGGIWVSRDHNTIWTQGGHYYHGGRWTNSSYFVPKEDIPQWRLWRMDLNRREAGWRDVTEDVSGHLDANRSFAGAGTSIQNSNKKFWVGGQFDSGTSPTTQNLMIQATKQMLEFDEADSSITKQDLYGTDSSDGYWQGNLIHLPIGNGSGYLMSLMSVKRTANVPWVDTDGDSGSFENGTAVSLEYIPMFDIDQGIWLKQQTTSRGWERDPEPRTRFCSALFYDAVNNTYDLWMHGGQTLSEQAEGVAEIYVLSMPSFTWTQVNTAYPQNNLIRSHTCHAVGGQLIIVGGYPTGIEVESNVTCDPDYIKVLAISEEDNVWTTSYRRNSTYRTPLSIRNNIGDDKSPLNGFANEQLRLDFESIQTPQCPGDPECPKKSHEPSIGAIVGIVIAALVAVILILLLLKYRRYILGHCGSRKNKQRITGDNPRSPTTDQPEPVTDIRLPPSPRDRISTEAIQLQDTVAPVTDTPSLPNPRDRTSAEGFELQGNVTAAELNAVSPSPIADTR